MPSSLIGYVSEWARIDPLLEAAVEGERRLTYLELHRQIERWSGALAASGVGKGERVAMLAPPGIDSLICLLAVISRGALWCGLDPRYRAQELAHRLADLEPKMVFAFERIGGRRPADEIAALLKDHLCVEQLVIVGEESPLDAFKPAGRCVALTTWLDTGDGVTALPAAPRGLEACLIVYTSGSSGVPKGAMLHESGIVSFCRQQNALWPATPLRVLNFLPISHAGSIVDLTLPTLVGGGCVVFQNKFDPLESLRVIVRERITFWASVPSTFIMQIALPEFASADLSSVQVIAMEGAPIPERVAATLMKVAPIATNYGMTECTSAITAMAPTNSVAELTGSVGRPLDDVELRIAKSALGDEIGEIEVRSSRTLIGYWRAEEATRTAFTDDGFFRTGDLGCLGSDGRLHLTGRKREMFKSGGYNVYPAEVEAVLAADDQVAAAVVVPAFHDVWGEVGVAFIVAKSSPAPAELARRLDERCRSSLADYKRPRQVRLLGALPLLPIGKVDRQALRKLAETDSNE